LEDEKGEVSREEGKAWAVAHGGLPFIETSATDDINVTELFHGIRFLSFKIGTFRFSFLFSILETIRVGMRASAIPATQLLPAPSSGKRCILS